eukprot:158793-Chlamydomonas_euryale.AAC.2
MPTAENHAALPAKYAERCSTPGQRPITLVCRTPCKSILANIIKHDQPSAGPAALQQDRSKEVAPGRRAAGT